jgi:hypothetical protein
VTEKFLEPRKRKTDDVSSGVGSSLSPVNMETSSDVEDVTEWKKKVQTLIIGRFTCIKVTSYFFYRNLKMFPI